MFIDNLVAAYSLTIQSELINFRFYVEDVEKRFNEKTKKVEEVIDLYLKEEVDEFWEREYEQEVESFVELQDRYKNDFPEIMRSSLLISVYSFFEQKLVSQCKPIKNGLSISDIRGGSVIDRAKKYLEKLMEVDFPANNEHWKFLREVSLIRNCIVHNGGFVEQSSNRIRNIINDMENIHINEYDKIIIEKGFVEEMIDHVDAFLFELIVQAKVRKEISRNYGSISESVNRLSN